MHWNHWATVTAIVTSTYGCPRTNMCLPGEVMVEGRCAADCPPGATNGCRDTGVPVDAALEAGDAMSCGAGQTRCGAECVDLSSSANHCGRCDMRCSALEAGTAVCSMGSCSSSCGAGTHACNGACVSNDAPTTCGTRCDPCPTPAGARATCVSQMCGIECLPGFERVGDSCEANVPRPIFPPGTSTVTSHRPTFRWELGTGTDGVVVEVCRDRACTMRVAMFDATGTSARPAMALPASTALFWRLRGRVGMVAGSRFSPTWQFRTRATDASVDTAFGTELDFNGDGFSDVAAGAPGTGQGYVLFALGGSRGLSEPTTLRSTTLGSFGRAIAAVGDLNGDGFGEIAIGAVGSIGPTPTGVVLVYFGRADGVFDSPTTVIGSTPEQSFGLAISGGDVNRDGWSDLLLGAPFSPPVAARSRGSFVVYNGSRSGVAPASGVRFDAPSTLDRVGAALAVGDTNGDGFGDVIVGAPSEDPATNGAALRFVGGSSGLAASFETLAVGRSVGSSVSALGDVNGDGIADIVIGVPRADEARTMLGAQTDSPTNSTTLRGPTFFGSAVTFIRDSNGDGFDELLVGGGNSASMFRGSAMGANPTAELSTRGPMGDENLGGTLASHSDINGDGRGDFSIGAPWTTRPRRDVTGMLMVYFGGSSPIVHRTFEGSQPLEELGAAIAHRGFRELLRIRPHSRSARWCTAR
ncbi:MAG: FG-GAP repeat protein [Myxococcales bacterium]|nr:FG-GAP repeat protein [Myxococcales bacterium]